jgi:hypothetical protein
VSADAREKSKLKKLIRFAALENLDDMNTRRNWKRITKNMKTTKVRSPSNYELKQRKT